MNAENQLLIPHNNKQESEVSYWQPLDFIELKGTIGKAVKSIPKVLNPWRGGQYFMDLHPKVSKVYQHTAGSNNFLSYLAEEAKNTNLSLEEHLKTYSPSNGYRLNLYDAYHSIYEQYNKSPDKKTYSSFSEFLNDFVNEKLELAPYLLKPFGDIEDNAIFTQYFKGQGIPAKETETISGSGYKYLYSAALFAILTEEKAGQYYTKGGTILLPQGYYQSLVSPLGLFKGKIETVKKMDAETIKKHLRDGVKAIVLTNPNNPNGEVLSEETLKEIGIVIENYNKKHPESPVTVISDLIYEGSVINKETKTPNIAGAYPPIHKHCVSITAPSKTFGFATSRIGIATTGNDKILAGMKQLINMQGLYHTSPVQRLTTAAAFSLIEQKWIDKNNQYYHENVENAQKYIQEINRAHGKELITFQVPQGGWYAVLKINKDALSPDLRPMLSSHMDLWKYIMFYDNGKSGTGVIAFPGSAMGYPEGENLPLVLRVTFGIPELEIKEMFDRIGHAFKNLKNITPSELQQKLNKAEHTLYADEHQKIVNKGKVLIFGGGIMGQHLLDSIIKSGISPQNIVVITKTSQKHELLKKKGVQCFSTGERLPKDFRPDTVMYAAPPQSIKSTIKIYNDIFTPGTQFISLAAGVKNAELESLLPADISVGTIWTSITLSYGTTPVPLILSNNTSYKHVRKIKHILQHCGPIVLVDKNAFDAAEAGQKIVFPLSLLASLSKSIQFRFNYNDTEAEKIVLSLTEEFLKGKKIATNEQVILSLKQNKGTLPDIIQAASKHAKDPHELCASVIKTFQEVWALTTANQGLSQTLSASLTNELLKSTTRMVKDAIEEHRSSIESMLKKAATPGGFTASIYNTLFQEAENCIGLQQVMNQCMNTITVRSQQIKDPNYLTIEKYLRQSMNDINSSIELVNVEASEPNKANFYFAIPNPSHALAERCKRLLPSSISTGPRSVIKNGVTNYKFKVNDLREAAKIIESEDTKSFSQVAR